MNVKYYVNAVEQTFVKRVLPTKTFAAVCLACLGVVGLAVDHQMDWKRVPEAAAVAVIAVLYKSALTRAELAANASNPNVPNVTASPKR